MAERSPQMTAKHGQPVPLRDGLYVCRDCGCIDVEGTAWLHLNTQTPVDSEPPDDDHYCPGCDAHIPDVARLDGDLTDAGDALRFTPWAFPEKTTGQGEG